MLLSTEAGLLQACPRAGTPIIAAVAKRISTRRGARWAQNLPWGTLPPPLTLVQSISVARVLYHSAHPKSKTTIAGNVLKFAPWLMHSRKVNEGHSTSFLSCTEQGALRANTMESEAKDPSSYLYQPPARPTQINRTITHLLLSLKQNPVQFLGSCYQSALYWKTAPVTTKNWSLPVTPTFGLETSLSTDLY